MADKYRTYRTDDAHGSFRDFDHDDARRNAGRGSAGQGDPLAELARLIGQDDPFAAGQPAGRQEPRALPDDDEPAPQWLTRLSGTARRYPHHHVDDDRNEHGNDQRYGGVDESPLGVRPDSMPRSDGYFRDLPPSGYDAGLPGPVDEPAHSREPQFDPRGRDEEPYAGSSYADSRDDPGYAHLEETDPQYADPRYADPQSSASPYAEPLYDDQQFDTPRAEDGAAYAHADNESAQGGYGPEPAYRLGHTEDEAEHYDLPVSRRRPGVIAVVAVVGLAVVGTAGAFGYRAYSGASGGNPPVILADAGPNKVVPATQNNDGSQNKLIYDRVADRAQGERVVSREEQPVDMKVPAPRVVLPGGPANMQVPTPPPWNVAPAAATPVTATNSAATSGSEAKRVKTVTIRPDQQGAGEAAKPPAPVRSAAIGPTPVPASAAPASSSTAVRTARVTSQQPAAGPLAIVPQGQSEPSAPARTAALPPAQARGAATSAGGAMVQLTSQKTESDAHASYRALQTRYPAVLGSREPVIRRADLGNKGVYYRAQVGPFTSVEQANEFCGSLKAVGGQCIVQRN